MQEPHRKTELMSRVLLELTDVDLEKIGVALGDRRKILRAIPELGGTAAPAQPPLTAAVASEPHTRLRYFCSPQHTDSAFYPIIGQMEPAAGFARDDAPESLGNLDAVLALTPTSEQDAALFAGMLSLPNEGAIRSSTLPRSSADTELCKRSFSRRKCWRGELLRMSAT